MESLCWPLQWPIAPFLLLYIVSEAVFFVLFYAVFLPRCNRPFVNLPEFRDCKKDRRLLLLRIMRRMERTCRVTGQELEPVFAKFLHAWFHYEKTKDEYGRDIVREPDDQLPCKGDVDELYAWGFFGHDLPHLEPWMMEELDRMYDLLRDEFDIVFPPGKNEASRRRRPMRLSLDHVEPGYRPLIIYFLFGSIQFVAKLALRFVGFRCYRTRGGLKYWYRDKRTNFGAVSNDDSLLPTLFFHGIAPGGLAPYLPLVLWGFGRDGRPLFLFENPAISFQICFHSPSETETIHGVSEALQRHLNPDVGVNVVGHSFGSCQVTWLLHASQLRRRIRQIVLLDPVAILLSEPDVISNFLYARNAWKKKAKRKRLGVVANELFIEHYLRRQFAWYNAELWLEDIPKQCKTIVCLSENDDVLNFDKVRRELEIHMEDMGGSMSGGVRPTAVKNMEVICWENATHASCVMRRDYWQQIRLAMRSQEHIIRKGSSMTSKTE
jgi:pimeloyl-ACP methyl ester carboxylesterase